MKFFPIRPFVHMHRTQMAVRASGLLQQGQRRLNMLNWAITFLVIALLAAVFGFTGLAVASAGIAKILFFVFIVLFIASLIGHAARRV